MERYGLCVHKRDLLQLRSIPQCHFSDLPNQEASNQTIRIQEGLEKGGAGTTIKKER